MKKILKALLPAFTAIAILALPCIGMAAIDTSMLQNAFKNASSADKAEVQKVLSAVKAHDYRGAMSSLGNLAKSGNLTGEQKDAIQKTSKDVQAEQVAEAKKSISGHLPE